MSIDLEKRIATALASSTTSAGIAGLIAETETAVSAADAAAAKIKEQALDPIAMPDPVKARGAVEAANFAVTRLRALLLRLQERLQEVQAAEYAEQWRSDHEALKAKRDALATELGELYPEFEAKISDLFTRIAVNDEELSCLHQARPAGVALQLLGAELVARNLEGFTRSEPSIAETLRLPEWRRSARPAWPKPRPSMAAQFATSMVAQPDRRYTADWAEAVAEDNARRAATEARWAAEEAAREAASRRAYESGLR